MADYTTLAIVKEDIGVTQAKYDATLTRMIEDVSRFIEGKKYDLHLKVLVKRFNVNEYIITIWIKCYNFFLFPNNFS